MIIIGLNYEVSISLQVSESLVDVFASFLKSLCIDGEMLPPIGGQADLLVNVNAEAFTFLFILCSVKNTLSCMAC